MTRRTLVLGSSGFVGRHLVAACSARGDEVVAVDVETGHDVMDFIERWDALDGHYDLVLHCAAYVKGRSGIDGYPAHLHAYNTMLDAAMFNWALQARPGRVVYFSSSAAYPVWDQYGDQCEPLREDLIDITEPKVTETSYGMVKLHGEQMAADVRDAGVPVTVARPFSGYGAGQSLDYPFPAFIARAKAREDPFTVWGSGEQARDWIHIDDIVAATLTAAELGIDGPVNLCTGRGTTFTELAAMVTEAAGYRPRIAYLGDRPAGVDYRVGDPTQLQAFFEPTVSLQDGIARALASA